YMREMGTVDLLTREGEIVIAKRIEEGIRDVQHAMAYWPGTVQFILDEYDLVEAGEKKLSDVITGFLDPEEIEPPVVEDDEEQLPVITTKSKVKELDDEDEDEEETDEEEDAEEAGGLDPELVRQRVEEIRELFATAKQALEEYGRGSPQSEEAYAQLADRFMLLKLNNRMSDNVMAIMHDVYDDVRKQERQIMRLVIRRGKMPRAEFRKTFPSNETNVDWLTDRLKGNPKFADSLAKVVDDVVVLQRRIRDHEDKLDMEIGEMKEVARR
ncbi:MAG TPA: RNA polymerase sigma factor RpoD, partial [Psychrobacter sp.]|nr:RNA polymerase sigma factor RpoD [Psychrobacter sp.]